MVAGRYGGWFGADRPCDDGNLLFPLIPSYSLSLPFDRSGRSSTALSIHLDILAQKLRCADMTGVATPSTAVPLPSGISPRAARKGFLPIFPPGDDRCRSSTK